MLLWAQVIMLKLVLVSLNFKQNSFSVSPYMYNVITIRYCKQNVSSKRGHIKAVYTYICNIHTIMIFACFDTYFLSLSHENYQIINVTVKIDEIKKNKINKTSKKPDNKMSETLHNLSDISVKWKIQNIKRCLSESPSFFLTQCMLV